MTQPDERPQNVHLVPGAKPPAEGNRQAVTHGGYAFIDRDRIGETIADLVDALAECAPVRTAGGAVPLEDLPMIRVIAETWCRRDDVRAWLDEHGGLNTKRPKWSVVEIEMKLTARLETQLATMGMTPAARIKLGVDLARKAASTEEAAAHRAARDRLEARMGDVIDPAMDGTG